MADRADRAWVAHIDAADMEDAVCAADSDVAPHVIIVMPHMGVEYETTTRQVYKNEVNEWLRAGADVVLATHPHVLQPAEFITVTDADGTERNCFVAYSLGNFVSAQRTIPPGHRNDCKSSL